MISRKDNLLIRPWQQRKFEHHRRKVQSALPAIDTNPPAYRGHVAMKLKKQQKEHERCKRIERDNYLLLQKMNYIMKTSRVDNVWRTPQPNFLNRIAIYDSVVPKIEDINFDLIENEQEPRSRKSKCYACRSQRHEEVEISETKIPWQPTAKKLITRIRSKSVPVQKSKSLPTIKEQIHCKNNVHKLSERAMTNSSNTLKTPSIIEKEIKAVPSHSIKISRGCLKLSVNFPSDTVVKFQKANMERMLLNEFCHCQNSRRCAAVH